MKQVTFITVSLLIVVAGLLSCKKEHFCEDCTGNNHPPLAIAGPDTVITLPTGSVLLMAISSAIPNGKISGAFGKNSGPASFRQYVVTLLTNKFFLNLKTLKHVEIKHS
jgi:hypothetical protein